MKMIMKSTHDEMLSEDVMSSKDQQIPVKASLIKSTIPEA
jgi:hypothetical protein